MKLLDAYAGQGGCAMGYSLAGFDDITGVDLDPKCGERYPFRFVQGDAIEYIANHWGEYDCIVASPVCKGYSVMNNLPWLKGKEYPLHILPLRIMLTEIHRLSGKPWVIENVMGARWGAKGLAKRGIEAHGMQAGWLCGTMFGLPFYRHRLFEASFFWPQPGHPKHQQRIRAWASLAGRARDVVFTEPKASLAAKQQGNGAQKAGVGVGHAAGWRIAAAAMGVEWMDRDGTSQAIPPAFTEYVGRWMLKTLKEA